MRSRGTFLEVHNRPLDLIAGAEFHDWSSVSLGKMQVPGYWRMIYPRKRRYTLDNQKYI
jgi:hypothetical protein